MGSVTAKQAKNAQQAAAPADEPEIEPQECFIIMPISDQPGYEPGHFTRVYRDIIAPACDLAGLKPCRADEDTSTNIIQHGILIKLLNAPVAICDLSSRNPNVMFELGLRQAFDKPVIIIQDEQTPAIFDISMLRYTSYRSGLLYHQVVEDQEKIASSIRSTVKDTQDGKSTNSLMKLLSINKAVLKDVDKGEIQETLMESIQIQLTHLSNRLDDLAVDSRTNYNSVSKKPTVYSLTDKELKLRELTRGDSIITNLLLNIFTGPYLSSLKKRVFSGYATSFSSPLSFQEYLDKIDEAEAVIDEKYSAFKGP